MTITLPEVGAGRPGMGSSALLTAVRSGTPVVLVDSRRSRADLVVAAERTTETALAFVVRFGSGIVQVAMTAAHLDALELPPMVAVHNREGARPDAVSVDLRQGTTTGISPADRSATIRALIDPRSHPDDFARPGHVFPIRATGGHPNSACGIPQAALHLVRRAGLSPAAALCRLMTDDGECAGVSDAIAFAAGQGLDIVSIDDVVEHR